ncbi:MAG: hypothetical protein MI920_02010 [Kiloniellales bacterium]|nr:hypothetical protein [Kiloniellales bacterium]
MSDVSWEVGMRVRIESDGTVAGTLVTDAETGEAIEGVQKVTLSIDARTREVTTTVELRRPAVDLVGDAEIANA